MPLFFGVPELTIVLNPTASPATDDVHVYVATSELVYVPELGTATFQLLFKDPSGSPLASKDLADIPWDVSAFPVRLAQWNFDGMTVYGTITSLVPEPAPVVLAALAAMAVLLREYRRARS